MIPKIRNHHAVHWSEHILLLSEAELAMMPSHHGWLSGGAQVWNSNTPLLVILLPRMALLHAEPEVETTKLSYAI